MANAKAKQAAPRLDEDMKRRGQFHEVWRRFRRNHLAMLGLFIAGILVLVAIFANVIAPYDPNLIDPINRLQMPSRAHLLGTDNFGRDLLSRLIYGTRVSLGVSLLGLAIALVISILLGATAGYFGGRYENILMRLTDILMCIPGVLLAVSISALLGVGVVNTAIAIAVSGVAPAIRMLRATVMQIREQEYVEAAKATGSRHGRIIFKQILPNTLSPIIVDSTMRIGGNILQISSLSFIGLGVQPPTSEWGSILSSGQEFITTFWPLITFPGIAIVLTVFAFNVMGDGLRDALDPRMKQ
ncbi:MAG: ABC transporter permease [Bradyrhizobium sp.]